MAARNPQTMAKRAREQAVREKRERKQAKKAEKAEARRLGGEYMAADSEQTDASSDSDTAADSEQTDPSSGSDTAPE